MDLLYTRRFDGFCLVSSDSDFTGLALRIREEGLLVYGFGERKTPEAFRNACHRFVFTEVLRPTAAPVAESLAPAGSRAKAAKPPSTKSKSGAATTPVPVVNVPTSAPATSALDTPVSAQSSPPAAEFPTALFRQALDQSSDEQGWAHLGSLGSHLTKLRSDFDARNFGYRKLSDLVRARPDLFEVDEREVAGSPTKNLYVRAK
jgi:hypothetical protein